MALPGTGRPPAIEGVENADGIGGGVTLGITLAMIFGRSVGSAWGLRRSLIEVCWWRCAEARKITSPSNVSFKYLRVETAQTAPFTFSSLNMLVLVGRGAYWEV